MGEIEVFKGVDRRFLVVLENPQEDKVPEEEDAGAGGQETDTITGFDDTEKSRDGLSGQAQEAGGVACGESKLELPEDFEERKKKLQKAIEDEVANMRVCEKMGVVKDSVKELVREAYLRSKELSKIKKKEEYTVHPLVEQRSEDTECEVKIATMADYVHLKNTVRKEIAVIQKRLRDIVLDEQAPRWVPGADKGKRIDRRLIARIPLGERNFFKYKVETDILNVAFFLLVDESGSMYGEKTKQARRCAIMFGEVLNTLGIPCMIAGYTTGDLTTAQMNQSRRDGRKYDGKAYGRSDNLRHNIYKRFHEPFDRVKTKLVRISAISGNYDQDHIEWAWNHLQHYCLTNGVDRKVLIVISDGQPCGGVGARDKLIRVINEIGCDPNAEIIGIGIHTDYVKDFYHKCVEIRNASELGINVVRLLESAIKKGRRKW